MRCIIRWHEVNGERTRQKDKLASLDTEYASSLYDNLVYKSEMIN
jgi:hypothetical protein